MLKALLKVIGTKYSREVPYDEDAIDDLWLGNFHGTSPTYDTEFIMPRKKKNPVAKSLSDSKYKPKVVPNKSKKLRYEEYSWESFIEELNKKNEFD